MYEDQVLTNAAKIKMYGGINIFVLSDGSEKSSGYD